MGNSFGQHFRVHTFGESHGPALGAIIDGCPAGVTFDPEWLRVQLARRRPGVTPGAHAVVSARLENDEPEILSGVFEGKTLGTPIAIVIRNQDARSGDYDAIKSEPRVGHADDVWQLKYGHRDHRGGGRASGRETVARVVGGAVARMFLRQLYPGLHLVGYSTQLGPFVLSPEEKMAAPRAAVDTYVGRFPSLRHEELKRELEKVQAAGDSWGGTAEILISQVPAGLGQPVFRKLKSDLAAALMSVGATSGFEIGERGPVEGSAFHGHAAHYGGIRGGISTGEDIILRVHFKPTSSRGDVAKKGRHDPCIVPRAIPVLESMVSLVLADHVLARRLDRVDI